VVVLREKNAFSCLAFILFDIYELVKLGALFAHQEMLLFHKVAIPCNFFFIWICAWWSKSVLTKLFPIRFTLSTS